MHAGGGVVIAVVKGVEVDEHDGALASFLPVIDPAYYGNEIMVRHLVGETVLTVKMYGVGIVLAEQREGVDQRVLIAKQAIEDEAPLSSSFTLRKILGGDILTAQVIRRQIWLIVLVVFFIIIYISNRYSIQQDMIEIDQLQEELQNAKYKALSSSSQITEKSRESNVLKMLQNNKDSVLHIATQPPYIINVPENE